MFTTGPCKYIDGRRRRRERRQRKWGGKAGAEGAKWQLLSPYTDPLLWPVFFYNRNHSTNMRAARRDEGRESEERGSIWRDAV